MVTFSVMKNVRFLGLRLDAALSIVPLIALFATGCHPGGSQPKGEVLKHFKKGNELQVMGSYKSAVEEYELGLKLDPYCVMCEANLALACHRMKADLRALQELKNAQDIEPDLADIDNYFGIIYMDQRRYADAEAAFHRAIETFPQYDDAYYNLGLLKLLQKKNGEARKAFLTCTQIDPKHVDAHLALGDLYLGNGVYKDAKQHYKLAEPDNPHPRAELGLGKIELHEEHYEEAIRTLRKAIHMAGGFVDKHGDRENAYKEAPAASYDVASEGRKALHECYKKAPKRLAKNFAKTAESAYQAKRADDAAEDCDSAYAIDPKLVDIPVIRAKIAFAHSDENEAKHQAKIALALDSRNRDARYILSVCSIQEKDWKTAEKMLRELRLEDPHAIKYRLSLGKVYFEEREFRKAEREWTDALKSKNPEPSKEQVDQIGRNFNALYAIPKFQKASELNKAGIQALAKQNDPDTAIEKFKEAIELDPQFAGAYANLSLAYLAKEDYPNAEGAARDALKIDDDLARAHSNLGVALMKQGHGKDARAEFDKATALDPNDPGPYYNLGVMFFEAKKLDEAEKLLSRATEMDPNHARAHALIGAIYREKGLYQKCESRLKLAIDADPKSAEPHKELAKLYFIMKPPRMDDAQKEIESVNQLTPSDPWLFAAFGQTLEGKDKGQAAGAYLKARAAYRDLGEGREALEFARKAVALVPMSSEAHMALGESLAESGLRSDAISELREAMRIDPTNLFAVFKLGECYEEDRDLKRAAETFHKVLDMNPQNYFAMEKLASFFHEGETEPAVSKREALELLRKARKLDPRTEVQEIIDKRVEELES